MKNFVIITYASILSLLSLSLLVLAAVLFFILCRRKPVRSEESTLPETKPVVHAYRLSEVDAATDGFNQLQVIGRGRLGTVYSAVLPGENQLVAVKRIHSGLVLSKPGAGFSTVLKTLSSARHPNIVSILGFSEAPGERIVVTEFIETTKSLDYYLNGDQISDEEAAEFDWKKRVKVAAGVARGLECLHEEVNIIHGRIKASNILIDAEFSGKISDYGFGFLIPHEKSGIAGYIYEGYRKESDVYGYGVVLLEILSGRRSKNGSIVKWAMTMIKEERIEELLDRRIVVKNENQSVAMRMGKVALACVGNSRRYRPSISQVAAILSSLERQCFGGKPFISSSTPKVEGSPRYRCGYV